jgi:hypothetical protein
VRGGALNVTGTFYVASSFFIIIVYDWEYTIINNLVVLERKEA